MELIGAKLPSIDRAEDRLLFKNAMTKIGLKTPTSGTAESWDDAIKVLPVGLPHSDVSILRLLWMVIQCMAGGAYVWHDTVRSCQSNPVLHCPGAVRMHEAPHEGHKHPRRCRR